MTPEERSILEEAEAQAFESSIAENAPLTTGIRPAPGVEGTESVLDGQSFGLDDFASGDDEAASGGPAGGVPHSGTIPPTGTTGACCIGGVCYTLTNAFCVAAGGTYMGDGSPCSPDPC